MSPFQALYGRQPPHILRMGAGQTVVSSLEENLRLRDLMLDELKFILLRAQQIMKKNADKNMRDDQFDIGERVFLKLQPYRQRSVARRPF